MSDAPGPWRSIEIHRVRDGHRSVVADRAATEAPLEIRLHGQPFVMTMRTPGSDSDLAAGFLLAEQVIGNPPTSASMAQADDESAIDITVRGAALPRLEARLATRRHVTATSACGVCGRQTADALEMRISPSLPTGRCRRHVVTGLPDRLRARQAVFDGPAAFTRPASSRADGDLVEIAEDVGRHNAVDKVVGRMLLRGALPLSAHVLCVSGRTSFEIVQKAVVAGIPMLVAVSAPSSLAVDLATRRCHARRVRPRRRLQHLHAPAAIA